MQRQQEDDRTTSLRTFPALNVQIERQQECTIVRCAGRMILEHGLERLERIGQREIASGHRVILDLTGVTQIDAHGIGVIARLCRTGLVHYRPVVIVGASARVSRVLELTHIDSVAGHVAPLAAGSNAPARAAGCRR